MDSKRSQELNHTNEQKYVRPADAPPTYDEAVGNTQPRDGPTAPPLETESTNPSANNVFPQNQYSQGGPAPVYTSNDPRFAQWDDRATRILIENRLRMNDQFSQARTQQDRDFLWNLILLELINDGYTNLMLYNLIEYWQFQFYIYQSILSGLSSSNATSSWQYFEPMHNVFGGNSSSGFTSDVLSSSTFPSSGPNVLPGASTTNCAPTTSLPIPIIGPTPIVHHTPIAGTPSPAVETPSTLPNRDTSNVQSLADNTSVSDAPSSSVQPIADAPTNVTSVTADVPSSVQPLADVHTTADTFASASDSVTSLGQQPSGNVNLETNSLLPTSSNDIELPTLSSTVDVVSASAVTPSLGDHISGDIFPSTDATTNLLSGIDSTSNDVGSSVIASQPAESLVPTLLSDHVITSQPTFSSPPLTTDDDNDADACCGDDDGCCGDDDCCGGDGGCCGGDGDGDCCGGDDGNCCAGCDDCGDCGDCDFV